MIPRLLLLTLAACSGGGAPAPTASPTAEGSAASGPRDMLVVAWLGDIGSLLYPVASTASDSELITAINYPTLDGTFEACEIQEKAAWATEWSFSEDGKTLSMTLRDGLTWEDGTPVTPADLELAYQLTADPAVASPRLQNIERLVPTARPRVIDSRHIAWEYTQAFDRPSMIAAATFPAVPSHKLADADRASLRGHPLSKQPLANGPWRLAAYEPNARIVLEPNPAFSGPADDRAKLARVVFRILPDYNTRLLELEAGKVDHMSSILVADADRLRTDHPEISLYRRGLRSYDYIVWNQKNPLFADVRVRTALATAVDIQGMIGKLLTSTSGEAYAKQATSPITPELCKSHNADITPITRDLDRARALMAEAGWTDTNQDGLLDKDGKPFTFTLATNAGNKRRADASVMVQAQLKELGVDVQLASEDANALAENLRKHDFEAVFFGWSAALFIDPSPVWTCPTPDHPVEFNYGSYCNPEVDALIQSGMATNDPAQANAAWREMQAKIYADQPYLFLWWMDEIVAVHSRFQHTEVNLLSTLGHLNHWEVPPDQVKYKR